MKRKIGRALMALVLLGSLTLGSLPARAAGPLDTAPLGTRLDCYWQAPVAGYDQRFIVCEFPAARWSYFFATDQARISWYRFGPEYGLITWWANPDRNLVCWYAGMSSEGWTDCRLYQVVRDPQTGL